MRGKKKAKGRGKSPLATGMKKREIFKVLKGKHKPSIWNSPKTSHMSVINFFLKDTKVTGLCCSDRRGHH